MEEKRTIKVFKTFEEHEMYFLKYFAELTPSELFQALSKLQKQNNKNEFNQKPQKKITFRKHFIYGY